MLGAIPPLPSTPSRLGAQLKHRDNFTLTSREYKDLVLLIGDYNSVHNSIHSRLIRRYIISVALIHTYVNKDYYFKKS
jgi:hypothetical protein